jgi:hypothetical protein
MTIKNKILELRGQGLTYDQIANQLNVSKGTIAYHCSPMVKKNVNKNRKKWRRKNTLSVKIHNFKYCGSKKRKKLYDDCEYDDNLNAKNIMEKIGKNPTCYLTGKKIDLDNPEEYSLDHVLPIARGGKSTLENCMLVCRKVNMLKGDLTYEELIEMCQDILDYSKQNPKI